MKILNQDRKIKFLMLCFSLSILVAVLFFGFNNGEVLGATSVALPDQGKISLLEADMTFSLPSCTPGPGVINVPAGDSVALQSALNNVTSGGTICLVAGSTYIGHFKPSKRNTNYVTVRSTRANELTAGVRVGPSDVPKMATIKSPDKLAGIAVQSGASHWRFVGLDITTASPERYTLVVGLGENSSSSTLAGIPDHLIIDRSYVHGVSTASAQVSNGIDISADYVAILNTYITDIRDFDGDNNAIHIGFSRGVIIVQNSFIHSAGENVLVGGQDFPVPLVPENIVFRGNYFWKDYSKSGYCGPSNPYGVKNMFELKTGRRVLIEGNVFDTYWDKPANCGSQHFAVVFKTANQGPPCNTGDTSDTGYFNQVANITMRYNKFIDIAQWLVLGRVAACPSSAPPGTEKIYVHDNLITGLGKYRDTRNSYVMGLQWSYAGVDPTHNEYPHYVTLEHNTYARPDGGNIWHDYTEGTKNFVVDYTSISNVLAGIFRSPGAEGSESSISTYYKQPFTYLRNLSVIQKPAYNVFQSAPNFYVSTYDGLFVNEGAGNYKLAGCTYPNGPCAYMGTDGKPVGADIDKLNSCTAGSINGTWSGCNGGGGGGSYISVSISANPASMTLPNNQTTLNWTTSGNPDSCTASNFWSGQKTGSGGSEQRTGMPAGTYIFDITCSKAGMSDATDSVIVVVNPIGGGGGGGGSGCINPSSPISGYATPCPVLQLSSYNISPGSPLTIRALFQSGFDYFYVLKTFYISEPTNACPGGGSKINGIWCPLTFSGTSVPGDLNNLTNGNYNLTASQVSQLSSGTHYIISWDWTWNGRCFVGPGSTTCYTGKWRLQAFTK